MEDAEREREGTEEARSENHRGSRGVMEADEDSEARGSETHTMVEILLWNFKN